MTNPNDITISDPQEIDPKSVIGKGMSGLFWRTDQLRWIKRGHQSPIGCSRM